MSNTTRTQQHKAVIQEYVSQNQDITIQVPILGHSWSSYRSILHRLAFQHDYWYDDPTNNCKERKGIQVEGHRITLILWVYEGNNYAFMAEVLRERNIFLLVYDVNDRNTFDYIKKFHAEVFGADQEVSPSGGALASPNAHRRTELYQHKRANSLARLSEPGS